jgi:hypothetical protein
MGREITARRTSEHSWRSRPAALYGLPRPMPFSLVDKAAGRYDHPPLIADYSEVREAKDVVSTLGAKVSPQYR